MDLINGDCAAGAIGQLEGEELCPGDRTSRAKGVGFLAGGMGGQNRVTSRLLTPDNVESGGVILVVELGGDPVGRTVGLGDAPFVD